MRPDKKRTRNRQKNKILKMLAENLKGFYPDLQNHFMCPTCLAKIPMENKNLITDAHIVPKSANGRLKTFLCRHCNSNFGTKQDKWFGEFLKMDDSHCENTILSAAIKDGYFLIDGTRVNGHWIQKDTKEFEFYIHTNHNSPEINKLMLQKFDSRPPKVKLAVSFPLLRNEHLIEIGFLTAGYLMWFNIFGYSWVLQKHLDIVRQQIMTPETKLIENKYLFHCDKLNMKPCIGFLPIAENYVPFFGINKKLVVYPSRSQPNLYSNLGQIQYDMPISDIQGVGFTGKTSYGQPLAIMFEDKVIILPDMLGSIKESSIFLHFKKGADKPQVLRAIDEVTFDRMKEMKNTVVINIKVDD